MTIKDYNWTINDDDWISGGPALPGPRRGAGAAVPGAPQRRGGAAVPGAPGARGAGAAGAPGTAAPNSLS